MSKAVKYFLLGFKNAFGSLTIKDFGGYELGELTGRISQRRKENLERLYGQKQNTKKIKRTA